MALFGAKRFDLTAQLHVFSLILFMRGIIIIFTLVKATFIHNNLIALHKNFFLDLFSNPR